MKSSDMQQKSSNERCIFCGKSKEEFDKNNDWSEEHIIPNALGNESLKIYNVCKKCNSGLGTYVDNYFVNHMFLKIIRENLGLKGQNGKIPNAFREGKDKDGNRIRVDENYQPTIVPRIERHGNTERIVASSKAEIKKMLQKKLIRMDKSEQEITDILNKVDQTKSLFSQPEIHYDITIEFHRFFLEALKIAFEYAIYKFGSDYLKDSRAIEIQQYLKNAIDGKMKKECVGLSGVSFIQGEVLKEALKKIKWNCHMIMIHPDSENKLIVEVILFMEAALSFSVLISNDASQFYNSSKDELVDIIEIKQSTKGKP